MSNSCSHSRQAATRRAGGNVAGSARSQISGTCGGNFKRIPRPRCSHKLFRKVFARLFQKAARIQRRVALVVLRRGRNTFIVRKRPKEGEFSPEEKRGRKPQVGFSPSLSPHKPRTLHPKRQPYMVCRWLFVLRSAVFSPQTIVQKVTQPKNATPQKLM